MTDCGLAFVGKHALEQLAFGDGHIHLGMTFHYTSEAFISLFSCLLNDFGCEKHSKQHRHDRDHQRSAQELRQRELPAEKDRHNDAQLNDEIGRAEFERHCRGKVCALAEQSTRDCHCGVRARRRCGSECAGDSDRPGSGIAENLGDFLFRHNRLHNP